MNLDHLQQHLRPWMRVETWHTGHPLDERRFHLALKHAFDDLGSAISYDDFRRAMVLLAGQLGVAISGERLFELVDRFAYRAEAIASFLDDTSNR